MSNRNNRNNRESGNVAVLEVSAPVATVSTVEASTVETVTATEVQALENAPVINSTPEIAVPLAVVAMVTGTMEAERSQLCAAIRKSASGMMGARAFLYRKVLEYATRWKIENSLKAIQAHFALFTFTDGTKLSADFLASCARAEGQRKAADKLGLATFNAWKNSMTEKDAATVIDSALGKTKKTVTPKTAVQRIVAAYAKLSFAEQSEAMTAFIALEAVNSKHASVPAVK